MQATILPLLGKIPPYKYNLDKCQEAEIWHSVSTHKIKIIQGVLFGLIGLVVMVWLAWVFSAIQISWMQILLRQTLGSLNLAYSLNSQKLNYSMGFRQFGLFSFWCGLVYIIYIAILEIKLETQIWHFDPTHKNKTIQSVLDSLVPTSGF